MIQFHESYQVGDIDKGVYGEIDQQVDSKASIPDTYRITITAETIAVLAGIASLSRFYRLLHGNTQSARFHHADDQKM